MSTDTGFDQDFVEVAESIFGDARFDPGVKDAPVFDAGLWDRLRELGLTLLTTPDSAGGSGAGWFEAYTLARTAAYHGVRLPLSDHDIIAAWLAGRIGVEVPQDGSVLAVGLARSDGSFDVPWGRVASVVLGIAETSDGASVTVIDRDSAAIDERTGLAGEPRDRVRSEGPADTHEIDASTLAELRARGALVRSAQIVGSLERSVAIAVEHARTREQFGRPLTAFQAVQGLLADAGAETALARAATIAAVSVAASGGPLSAQLRPVAVAKSCASHAAGPVTRNAHQVLGAIGTTREHELHRYTLSALAWRQDYGAAADWDRLLGEAVADDGLDATWLETTALPGGDAA